MATLSYLIIASRHVPCLVCIPCIHTTLVVSKSRPGIDLEEAVGQYELCTLSHGQYLLVKDKCCIEGLSKSSDVFDGSKTKGLSHSDIHLRTCPIDSHMCSIVNL